MLLKDKVVIVTGVGPGMGRKLASIAAEEGAKVVMCARSEALLKEVADEITAKGGTAIAVPTDVGDMAQCERLVAAALKEFGRIDGVVNSAYRPGAFAPFEDVDLSVWQANMDITCFGALRMAKAVLPVMKRQHSGSIVNISAVAVARPAPGQADYATAKSAVEGATRQLAEEFGKYNIRVNAMRIGFLWGTPLQNYFHHMAETQGIAEQQLIDGVTQTIPLGVIPPDEECAKSVLMFVSDYARMITGTTVDVNGGQYMSP